MELDVRALREFCRLNGLRFDNEALTTIAVRRNRFLYSRRRLKETLQTELRKHTGKRTKKQDRLPIDLESLFKSLEEESAMLVEVAMLNVHSLFESSVWFLNTVFDLRIKEHLVRADRVVNKLAVYSQTLALSQSLKTLTTSRKRKYVAGFMNLTKHRAQLMTNQELRIVGASGAEPAHHLCYVREFDWEHEQFAKATGDEALETCQALYASVIKLLSEVQPALEDMVNTKKLPRR